jgi:2-oxoisovalerate dehydrogenase E1 component subunit alpha
MKAYLLGRGASEEFFADVDAECAAVAEDIRVRTGELGGLEPDAMFQNVYSEPHPLVDEQRRWFADYEASFEGEAS